MSESKTKAFRSGERVTSSTALLQYFVSVVGPVVAFYVMKARDGGLPLPDGYDVTVMLFLQALVGHISGHVRMFFIRREELSIFDGFKNWLRIKPPNLEIGDTP